ncbi:membrane protein [Leifsonia lichenia]
MSHHTMSARDHSEDPTAKRRITGIGRVLVFVYGVLALAATGRSVFQIIDRFHEAPVAFTLSALAAVVYIVATVALVAPGRAWYRVAWITITFELVGVLVIGSLSLFAPEALGLHDVDPFGRDATVWSVYGMGYLFIPLVLPILGLIYLRGHKPRGAAS